MMARIRSIHPGFFTDEDLVAVSMPARLLFLGIGVEADDKGVFEWKPLTLKMRIFPGDNIDVAAMLSELEAAGSIRKYDVGGKLYGAIRNFRKFQKPKTPNDIHPATAEILDFVGLVSENGRDEQPPFPPKEEAFPQKGEKSPQMEDGGGREGGKGKSNYAFSGRVIRLTKADYGRWEKAYPLLDLTALLQSRDDWLHGRPGPERKNWFNSTSSWLSRKQQEGKTAQAKGEEHAYPIV